MTAVGCHVLNDNYFYNCIVAWLIFLKISFQFHSQKMPAILFWVFVAHGCLIKMEISYGQNCQFYCKPDISVLILAWLLLRKNPFLYFNSIFGIDILYYNRYIILQQIYYITIDILYYNRFTIFNISNLYVLYFKFLILFPI